jgi:hypothetical protein
VTTTSNTAASARIDELTDWASRFTAALDALRRPMAHLLAPPGTNGAEPLVALDALLSVRSALSVDDNSRVVNRECAMRQAAEIYSNVHRFDTSDRLLEVVRALDYDIAKVIAELPADLLFQRGLVRVADFEPGQLRHVTMPGLVEPGTLTGRDEQIWFVSGPVNTLPAGHPLRSLLPDEDLFELDRSDTQAAAKGWVLGRTESLLGSSAGRAKPFYSLQSLRQWTTAFRRYQRQQDEEREYRERQEERQRQREFWESPLGKQLLLEKQLAAMKERGEVPELGPAPEPAVRVGTGPRPKSTVTEMTP